MSQSEQPFFLVKNESFRLAEPADDYLHPQHNAGIAGDSLTETQYLGITSPEHGIHGMGYLWHHPNLKVLSGGIWVYQGVNTSMLDSEMVDVRMFMNDGALKDDLHRYRLDNGYGVEVIKPLEHLHLTYEDAKRGNAADLHYTAVTPAVMFGDGKHFEQTLRIEGELQLRGQKYKVRSYNVRDRSWAKLRPEDPMALPPTSWTTGVFNDELSFNCNIFDHPSGNPEIAAHFDISDEHALNTGWIWRGDRFRRIVSASKQVRREPGTHIAQEMQLRMVDEDGVPLNLRGRLIASSPWYTWSNVKMVISLMRWESEDGLVGHGDCQEPIWTDYSRAFRKA